MMSGLQTILWFEQIGRNDHARAGGKGANLGELVRAGLPVPPGFVVAAAAYRAHLEAAGLQERIASRLSGVNPEVLAEVERACQEIAGWIESAPMPASMAAELASAHARLTAEVPSRRVAVRSSATAEDLPDASFAGQQETFLNLEGEAAVLAAVKRCWASLWAPRAVAYRSRMGYDHLTVSLAAVVQVMVPAEVAGVMFTAHPMTGDPETFLVNASYGLGEAVVSGQVTPDTFTLESSGRVKDRVLGAKAEQVVSDAGGIRTEPVSAVLRGRYCLSEQELVQLAELGRKVTAHYGQPQDIEWACARGQFYLLQARPITAVGLGYQGPALSRSELAAHRQTIDNVMDHWPEPMRPLDAAIYRIASAGLVQAMERVGAKLPPNHRFYVELADGRIALRPLAPVTRLPMLWRLPAGLCAALGKDPAADWPRLEAEYLGVVAPLEASDPTGLDAPALAGAIEQLLSTFERLLPERFASMFIPGVVAEGVTMALSRMVLGKGAAADASRALFTALPYATARMNLEVRRLAETAVVHGRDSAAFAEGVKAFLRAWGCRPTRGMEPLPSVATWGEEPAAVTGLVDALLADPAFKPEAAVEAEQQREFAAIRDRVAGRLIGPLRRRFLHNLEMARRYIVAREASLVVHERLVYQVRRYGLALGERLAAVGRLAEPADLFYLLETEIGPTARGQLDPSDRIPRRKRAFQQVRAAHRRGENWMLASGSLPEEVFRRREVRGDQLLAGIGASSGQVTGRVCIVRDQTEFAKLKRGEILVAPVTAPAWTPLFGMAAAVVTDVGGPLSHAAIVAREYGIPAVLGTGAATSRLQDGQMIMVDGSAGFVATAPPA